MSRLSCKTLKQASQLVKASSEMLGSTQRDGFGYALNNNGSVFIERYLNPATCSGMGTLKASRDLLHPSLQTQLVYGSDYDQHGEAPSIAPLNGCFIAHGRTATCDKVIANTHPFTGWKDGKQYTIAHNGVVAWNGDKLPLQTTCDSEHILNCFLHLNGEQSFKDGLSGYAAVVGINPQNELFALRDDRAPLYVQYVKELSLYILCTDSTHCEQLSKMVCGFNGCSDATTTTPMMIAPFVKHTFHANGDITSVEFSKFDSGAGRISAASVNRSLGSAGAAGYGSWDDDYSYYGRTYRSSNYSTPVASKDEKDAGLLDEHRKQQLAKHRSNSQKPWKHSK